MPNRLSRPSISRTLLAAALSTWLLSLPEILVRVWHERVVAATVLVDRGLGRALLDLSPGQRSLGHRRDVPRGLAAGTATTPKLVRQ